jgi:plasmid maintenance system antidote protein VapI
MDDLEDYKEPGTLARDELFTQVYAVMIRQGINYAELAKRLHVSRAAVSQMLKRPQSVTLERAEKIARAVGMTLHVYLTPRLDEGGDP